MGVEVVSAAPGVAGSGQDCRWEPAQGSLAVVQVVAKTNCHFQELLKSFLNKKA